MKALPQRLRRPLSILLIAAGWLSILGNSPPGTVESRIVARTGTVALADESLLGCEGGATASTPVRQARYFKDTKLLHELTCMDGNDCLRQFTFPLYRDPTCQEVKADAAADVLETATDSSVTDATGDGSPDLVTQDALSGDAGAADVSGIGMADGSVADAGTLARQIGPSGTEVRIYSCIGASGKSVEVKWSYENFGLGVCEDSTATFRLEVESSSGAKGTIDYKMEYGDDPPGYFGC